MIREREERRGEDKEGGEKAEVMFRIRVSRVEELMGDAFQGCGKPKPP